MLVCFFLQHKGQCFCLLHDSTKLLLLIIVDGLEHPVLYPRREIPNKVCYGSLADSVIEFQNIGRLLHTGKKLTDGLIPGTFLLLNDLLLVIFADVFFPYIILALQVAINNSFALRIVVAARAYDSVCQSVTKVHFQWTHRCMKPFEQELDVQGLGNQVQSDNQELGNLRENVFHYRTANGLT